MVGHIFNSSTQKQKQVGLFEFKASQSDVGKPCLKSNFFKLKLNILTSKALKSHHN